MKIVQICTCCYSSFGRGLCNLINNINIQLLRQAKMVEEAERYQKERNKIIADNIDLHKQVDDIKAEYQQKEDNLEWKYEYVTIHSFYFLRLNI